MARPLSNGIPQKAETKVESESKDMAGSKGEKKEFGSLTLNIGRQLGKSYAIGEKGLIIGRDPAQCDIIILDPSVSRMHARVTVKKEEVVIIDRGSTNGTYVNQVKVEKATLKSGDIIRLGKKCNTALVFNR